MVFCSRVCTPCRTTAVGLEEKERVEVDLACRSRAAGRSVPLVLCRLGNQLFPERLLYAFLCRIVAYQDSTFQHFLADYTRRLNQAYTQSPFPSHEIIEKEVKQLFAQVPSRFGLSSPRSYQHPKQVMFNALYSGVGVLGYMGPFFAESQLNRELPPLQWPFTYAHEYSHLLGISSEAEANFWAYQICIRSVSPAVRYSGYFGLLPYVLSNAATLLEEEDYRQLLASIRPEILQTLREKQAYWQARYNPWVGRVQELMYEYYLKGNQIPSGQKNYAEVVAMILALPGGWWK